MQARIAACKPPGRLVAAAAGVPDTGVHDTERAMPWEARLEYTLDK